MTGRKEILQRWSLLKGTPPEPNSSAQPLRQYGLALLLVALAIGSRWLLDPWLEEKQPFAPFYIAVTLAAWWVGWQAALVAAVLGFLAANLLFLPPRYALWIAETDGLITSILFWLVSGSTIYFIHQLRTVQHQLRVEKEAINRARLEWERTFDSVPDLIAILDPAHRIVRVNRAMAERLGKDPAACRGLTCFECIHGLAQPPAFCPHALTLQDGQEHEAEYHEERLEGDFLVTNTPLRNEQGELVGSVHVARDITARKQAETALRQREEELRYHVENSPLAVIEWDSQFRVRRWNGMAEKVFGWMAEEVVGKHPSQWNIVHQEDRAQVDALIARLLSGQARHIVHFNRNYHKDGSVVHCEWYNSALLDPQGRLVSFLSLALDVTERKQAEAEALTAKELLVQANADLERKVAERTAQLTETVSELNRYSYSITHDLRAPLRAIRQFTQILLTEHAQECSPAAQEFVRRVEAAATRMDRLIQDVLSYSRVVQGEFRLEPVDVDALLTHILEDYPNLQPPHASVQVDHPLLPVQGNSSFLTQCLSNLLGNAVKFVAPGVVPQIHIWTEPCEEDRVRIWVADNGVGIEPQDLDRIFEVFERVHTSQPYEGTGIGLSIVRKSVERMGGRVGVQSQPGQGSRFWIELALAEAASS